MPFNHQGRDSPTEVRNDVYLVVATLIAAVTFLVGVSTPGAVWPDNSSGRVPGQAIYASQTKPFYSFLVCNTLAFAESIDIIISLAWSSPFYVEVVVITVSMAVTYGSAVSAVTPKSHDQFRWLLFTGIVFVPFLLIQLGKCLWKCYLWLVSMQT